jgi:hypothetical protein
MTAPAVELLTANYQVARREVIPAWQHYLFGNYRVTKEYTTQFGDIGEGE